jgi:hypothetical protein
MDVELQQTRLVADVHRHEIREPRHLLHLAVDGLYLATAGRARVGSVLSRGMAEPRQVSEGCSSQSPVPHRNVGGRQVVRQQNDAEGEEGVGTP